MNYQQRNPQRHAGLAGTIRRKDRLQNQWSTPFLRDTWVLSLDPNTYRLWKQILTSSVFGSTATQAPATTKIQISQVVSPLCQISQNMHVFMKISLLRKTHASCKLRKQKTQIPAIKQFQVKREEQNAICQCGSLPTCLCPCGATTT